MKLYSFFRSGTSHRLRIALNLKGVAYDTVAVDLRREQHLEPEYRALNPQGLVPALVLPEHGGQVLIQSPAIIEWLEERHPTPPLLPAGRPRRARARSRARGDRRLRRPPDQQPAHPRSAAPRLRRRRRGGERWCAAWIGAGFDAFEALLAADTTRGAFCFGDTPTLADVYLVPQIESARRFNVDIARWPHLQAVDAACAGIDAFRLAAPALQPDAA